VAVVGLTPQQLALMLTGRLDGRGADMTRTTLLAAALLALAGPAWATPTYSGTFTTANQLFWFEGTVNANNVFQEASLTTLAPPGGALMAFSGWQSEPAGCWQIYCAGLFANDFAGNGPGNNFSVNLTSGSETEIVFAIGWLGNGPLDNSLFDPFYHPDGFNHFDPLATPFAHDGQPEWTGGTCQGAFCGGNCNGVACNSNATDGSEWAFTTSGVDNIVELSASPFAVPEPASGLLLFAPLLALLWFARRQHLACRASGGVGLGQRSHYVSVRNNEEICNHHNGAREPAMHASQRHCHYARRDADSQLLRI
jgi:hypothetical protein